MTEETQITPQEARIAEVAQYEANIAMYTAIKATLPTEWPDHLVQHRGAKNKHEVAGTIADLKDVELLSKLWYADECDAAIRSETVEMTKAKAILGIMQK
jgi:cell wall assembly regulator SMI1